MSSLAPSPHQSTYMLSIVSATRQPKLTGGGLVDSRRSYKVATSNGSGQRKATSYPCLQPAGKHDPEWDGIAFWNMAVMRKKACGIPTSNRTGKGIGLPSLGLRVT